MESSHARAFLFGWQLLRRIRKGHAVTGSYPPSRSLGHAHAAVKGEDRIACVAECTQTPLRSRSSSASASSYPNACASPNWCAPHSPSAPDLAPPHAKCSADFWRNTLIYLSVTLDSAQVRLVRLDQPYLVDVGFGGSSVEPLPLTGSEREERPHRLELSELRDSYWRFAETAHGDGDAFNFDISGSHPSPALFRRHRRRHLVCRRERSLASSQNIPARSESTAVPRCRMRFRTASSRVPLADISPE